MTLTERGDTVSGTYGRNGISGKVSGTKFAFTYFEPGVTGEGEFELSADGQSFSGKWRPNGSSNWSNWTGKRVKEVNPFNPGQPKLPGEVQDEPRPKVYRYGHLPEGLPDYFYTIEGDSDKDGQIGLYEWVRYWDPKGVGLSEEKLNEFKSLDLNSDGLITPEEYLRANKRPKTTSKKPEIPGNSRSTIADKSR